MQYVLLFVGGLFGTVSLVMWMFSRTAIHEIQAAMLLLIAAVLISSAAIVAAIAAARKDLARLQAPQLNAPPR